MSYLPKRTPTLSFEIQKDPFTPAAVPGRLGDVNQHQDPGLEESRRQEAMLAVKMAVQQERNRELHRSKQMSLVDLEMNAIENALFQATRDVGWVNREDKWKAYLRSLESSLVGNLYLVERAVAFNAHSL